MPSDKGFTGKRLRRLREEKHLTRAAVARKAGIDSGEFEKIESGGIDPTLEALQRIADSMEVSLADLLSLPPSPIACEIRLVSENEAAYQAAG